MNYYKINDNYMEKRFYLRSTIVVFTTIIGVDLLSYWRRRELEFLDFEYLKNPILLLIFIAIVLAMIITFAKFLSYMDSKKQ